MRLEGRSPTASTAQKSKSFITVSRGQGSECAIHYICPARLVPRLRVTSPQPPSFRARIATAEEREECLSGLLPNNSPTCDTTRNF